MSYYDVLIELPLVGLFIAFSSFLLFHMKVVCIILNIDCIHNVIDN